MQASERVQKVQTPIIPTVAEWIQQTPDTISLGQGVVHYIPPQEAFKQREQSLQDPDLHKYKAVGGIKPLVEAIETKLRVENRLVLSSHNQVLVTAGSNMGFMNAVLAITNPGDEIILPLPYYFNHEMAITLAGCTPVLVPTTAQYQLKLDSIQAAMTKKTRAIVTVSPNNPTGAVYSQADLEAVNALCKAANIYHISDEAYEYFTYEDCSHFSPGMIQGANSHTISLFSLSKAYGFASWRIGYMVFPEHLRAALLKIQDTILICPPVLNQYAALGALEVGKSYCLPYLNDLGAVRQLILQELEPLGNQVQVPQTQGAFYFFIKIEDHTDSVALVRQLIEQYRVAVIPGSAFGLTEGCYLRVSYGSLAKETVAQGIGRLVEGLKHLVA